MPTLTVAGRVYGGWTSLRASVGLEYAAGSFDLEVTERWPGGPQSDPMPISAGQGCELRLGSQVLISGWIDGVLRDLGPDRRTVQIAGRDASADLVDCSAVVRQYRDQGLLAIAEDQFAPYGIGVTANQDLGGPFGAVAVEPGQTVWEFLERLARQRGALVMPDGRGNVVIGGPSAEPAGAALVEGQNLLGIRGASDWRGRYGTYTVLGQSAGSDARHGDAAAHATATATDSAVSGGRYRPLILVAEEGETDLQARADWEQRVRYARSVTATCLVQGWEAAPGRIWLPGRTVQVRAPSVQIEEELIIAGCTYSLSERGTLTDLALARRGAYEVHASPPESAGTAGGDWWS